MSSTTCSSMISASSGRGFEVGEGAVEEPELVEGVVAKELGVAPDPWARELLGRSGDLRGRGAGGGGSVATDCEADGVSPC